MQPNSNTEITARRQRLGMGQAVPVNDWMPKIAPPEKQKRVIIRMPEWMTTRTEFDDHMSVWRRFMGSSAKRHILRRAIEHGLTYNQIVGNSRRRELIFPRFVIYYELHVHFGKSFPEIGRLMNRDHSTVHHGYRQIAAMIERGEYVPEGRV